MFATIILLYIAAFALVALADHALRAFRKAAHKRAMVKAAISEARLGRVLYHHGVAFKAYRSMR